MKTWDEVVDDDDFKGLAPEQQEAARKQYFTEVVAPRVPKDKLQLVQSQFDADTRVDLLRKQEARAQDTGAAFATGTANMGIRVMEGVKQIYNAATGNKGALERQAAQQSEIGKTVEETRKERPAATTLGEIAPLVALPAVSIAGSPVLGAAAVGAGTEALSYGSPEERATRAGLAAAGAGAGAKVGQWLGKGAGRVVTPVKTNLSPTQQAVGAKAEDMGVVLTPGQKTGSKPLQILESVLTNLPGSSGRMAARSQANAAAVNRLGAKSIGEDAENVAPDVLAAARNRIGGEFARLSQGKAIDLDAPFFAGAKQARSFQDKLPKTLQNPKVISILDEINSIPAGKKPQISGEVYQALRSELGSASNDAFKANNSRLGKTYDAMQKALDDAATRSLKPADRKAWESARKQWTAMRTLETGEVVDQSGNLNPPALAKVLKQKDPKGFREGTGQGELYDIGRYGDIYKPKIPESGTAPRSYYQNLITNPFFLAGAGGLGAPAFGADPSTGAMALVSPYLASKALLSKTGSKYLTNQALSKELEEVLTRIGEKTGRGIGISASQ